jgi:hypothetical protein
MSARQQLDRLADAIVEDILNLSDEEILEEMREDGKDPEQVAVEMRVLFDRVALFAMVEDVNSKPRPRWEERLERLVEDRLVGEALSLVRWLLTLKELSAGGKNEAAAPPTRTV